MVRFILNDGGREACGFEGRVGDCVARSVAIATGRPYHHIYVDLSWVNATMRRTKNRPTTGVVSASHGIYTQSIIFKRFMIDLGFVWTPTMGIGTGCRVHLVAEELPKGRLVVALSKHSTAVIDGVIHDTSDPSRGGKRCVYGFWKLER